MIVEGRFLMSEQIQNVNGNRSFITTKQLVVSAALIALAVVADVIAPIRMPFGGSLSYGSLLFLSLIGYFNGIKVCVLAGIAFGLLKVIMGGFVLNIPQLLLDYPVAFGALGLSGLFYKQKYGLLIGYVVGVLGRYLAAVLSGVIFFYQYAPEGTPALIYSLGYNLTYIIPEFIICMILISIPALRKVIGQMRSNISKEAS